MLILKVEEHNNVIDNKASLEKKEPARLKCVKFDREFINQID